MWNWLSESILLGHPTAIFIIGAVLGFLLGLSVSLTVWAWKR